MSNPEDQSSFQLVIGGQPYEANRSNTTFYGYFGHLACYNHVFHVIKPEKEGDDLRGVYIFGMTKGFNVLVKHIVDYDFPAHVNQLQVAECDMREYERQAMHDLRSSEFIPDGWTDAPESKQ
jgi:hypothetical protein